MGIDRKYGRVTLEHGTIADDEPVFVLRAQDALAERVLRHYANLCRDAGSPPKHVFGIGEAAGEFLNWQREHHTQIPRSDPPAASG